MQNGDSTRLELERLPGLHFTDELASDAPHSLQHVPVLDFCICLGPFHAIPLAAHATGVCAPLVECTSQPAREDSFPGRDTNKNQHAASGLAMPVKSPSPVG